VPSSHACLINFVAKNMLLWKVMTGHKFFFISSNVAGDDKTCVQTRSYCHSNRGRKLQRVDSATTKTHVNRIRFQISAFQEVHKSWVINRGYYFILVKFKDHFPSVKLSKFWELKWRWMLLVQMTKDKICFASSSPSSSAQLLGMVPWVGWGWRGEENGRVGWGRFSRDGVIGPTPSKVLEYMEDNISLV